VSGRGAVVGHDSPESCRVGGQGEPPVPDLLWLVTVNRFTSGWRTIPPLVNVAHQLVTANEDIAGVAVVLDDAFELSCSVDELKSSIDDISRHPTLKIATNRWKFRVEPGGEAVPSRRTHQEMTLVTDILDARADVEVVRDEGAVRRLLRLTTSRGSMLADVVQL